MDPGTGLTILGTAIGSAKIVEKILGPTADYLGNGIRDWTERSLSNVGRVFEKAQRKLGEKLDGPGTVPPKVLKGILEEAPFCDDELAAEYFGGVLASSRSEVGRDDRGAAFTSLLGRLSTYEIRSHFFFYTIVRRLYRGVTDNIAISEGRARLTTFVPLNAYVDAMEFGENENLSAILTHVMFGLSREALIEGVFLFGSAEHLRPQYAGADAPGILFSPSALGVELFLWAHGKGDLLLTDILDSSIELDAEASVAITPGIRSTNYPDRLVPGVALS